MVKICVAGLDTLKTREMLEKYGAGRIQAAEMVDMQAINEVKSGRADYYVGACNTGGGGALAMAQAILGVGNCFNASRPGVPRDIQTFAAALDEGKIAFGMTVDHIEDVIPVLAAAMLDKHK